jgi:hypothetical protein
LVQSPRVESLILSRLILQSVVEHNMLTFVTKNNNVHITVNLQLIIIT